MLEILHISPTLRVGGVANVWINLTKAFTQLGHKVHLVGPHVEAVENYVASYYKVIEPNLIRDPFYALAYTAFNNRVVKKALKSAKVDVVLTHGPLALLCFEDGPKCFSVVHGTYANECRFMNHHSLSGFDKIRITASIRITHLHDMKLYRYATAKGITLIAVSENTRRELIKEGSRPSNVYSILNGVDKTTFKPINKDEARRFLEERYGVKMKDVVIAHVGLGTIKGTHILIKALAMLKRVGVEFTALFCGGLRSSSFRDYIEFLIEKFGLSGEIKFLGFIPYKALPFVYSAADVTVVPSYSEGGPLVTPESLACGTPVIATDVGGNPEYLKLAELEDLLVEIDQYDFTTKLFLKLYRALNDVDKYRLRTLKNIHRIPSWIDVALEYSKLFTLTSGFDNLQ